ncbi:MAG: hypothetical protein IKN64_12570 [Desulfovibrio sp.]|nr:hypothetical protein [Desulfovibrio sp.]
MRSARLSSCDFFCEGGGAIPYGIYDISRNESFVNVGISSDTAEFAVNSMHLLV